MADAQGGGSPIRAARTPQARLYLPLFILIGLYTGRRKEAILSLRWPQVDLHAGTIDFEVAGRRRTNKKRGMIPIPPRLLPHLRRARRRGTDLGYVLHINGERIRDIKKGFAAACERARHRRCLASYAEAHGSDLAHAGRHRSLAGGGLPLDQRGDVLRVYGHHHPDYQREAAENIGRRPQNVRVIA